LGIVTSIKTLYIPSNNQSWSRVGLEYCLFKNERKKAHGKEMMSGLIHQAFF